MPGAEREGALGRIASGEIDIVIGTHALLTTGVRFASLALAITDEQHRFGVQHRAGLREKGAGGGEEGSSPTPHVLVMTATPIPRTMALTAFGDLDISTITGLPPGRTKIATRLVGPEKAGEVYAYVRERLDAGDQAYIVVPTIEAKQGEPGPDEAEIMSVRALQEALEAPGAPLAGVRIAAMHGRLSRRHDHGAGRDDHHRGGGRCAQRDGHGRGERRPIRAGPAAPVARAHRARREEIRVHPDRRSEDR
jgi:ATP-dependent DNA helicase RecG